MQARKKAKQGKESPMRTIALSTVTLHCSSSDPAKLARAKKLLEFISKQKAVMTLAKKRIPAWKIRPGMPIGCKVTLRGKAAIEMLQRLFAGVTKFSEKQFGAGMLAFGIKEYIEVPSIPYQRDIGIMGFDVVARLQRPGFRVALRSRARARIGAPHRLTKRETIDWFKKQFKLEVEK